MLVVWTQSLADGTVLGIEAPGERISLEAAVGRRDCANVGCWQGEGSGD
jgi:hypothetical protein